MIRFFVAVVLLLCGVSSSAQERGVTVDDFDGSKKLHHWLFLKGEEFPGANGSLSLGPGYEGHGAALAYRFTCLDAVHCGHYVAAMWRASSPIKVIPGATLTLQARFSPDVSLVVRVQDETGQTLQFPANTLPLESEGNSGWLSIAIPITTQAEVYWGGANSGQIQGRLAGISILANSRFARASQGEMEFDNVRLVPAADSVVRLDPAAAVIPAPQGAGELRSRLGVNIHFLKDDRALDIARDAGFGFVRADLPWEDLEKDGQYDFAPFDRLMRSLEVRGMGVLWLLAYGHPDHGGNSLQSAKDIAAYANYAAAVVRHFRGQNARFEIWNEPNQERFLASPSIYPNLLRSTLDAIRREDPNAAVSTGGTSGFDFAFLNRILASGSAQQASALAVHPYRDGAPETLFSDLVLWHDLASRSALPAMPIWDTEWGYTSNRREGSSHAAEKRQALLAIRQCLTVWALGLPVGVWYDLRDDGPDPLAKDQNYGLLHRDYSDKPAMQALRVLTNIAQGHKFTGLLRDVPYGVHAMRLDGTSDIVFVLWIENETQRNVQFSRDALISASTMYGEPIVMTNKDLILNQSLGPVYLRFKR